MTMNYMKLSYILLLAIAVASSCSSDNEILSTKSEYVNAVRVTVEDFLSESPSTRTAYTVDGNGFQFQWADGDALGIYPVGGDQVKFPISTGDGAKTAFFDGGAWKLRSEYQYAAYYPFSVDNYKKAMTEIPVKYTTQTQNGNASTAHLSARDYLACAATSPNESGGVDLTMKHLGAFVRFQLTMPKADTFSAVELATNTNGFVLGGKVDLSADVPTITPMGTTDRYTISLTNISTTEKNQMITVYAMFAPTDLSGRDIKVTVHGTGQTTYVQTVQGKNFSAGLAYNIEVKNFPNGTNESGEEVSWEEPVTTGIENGHEWVDLGLPSGLKWATMNVGATSPEDYGDYFAWGETTGYGWDLSDGHLFDYASYKWSSNGSDTGLTKYTIPDNRKEGIWYNGNTFIGDNKTTLDPEDDAAHVNWGGSWRMPTRAEQDELRNESNCTWTWITWDGVDGFKIISKNNGNSIFIPAASCRAYGYHGESGYGHYMSSSLAGNSNSNICINFNSGILNDVLFYFRLFGQSVRAVCP